MSDLPKTREEAFALREAFLAGAHWRFEALPRSAQFASRDGPIPSYVEAAFAAYPPPKVERRRVVADPHGERVQYVKLYWTSEGRNVVKCDAGGGIIRFAHVAITPERVAVWADLLANPTEWVEETPDAL